MYRIQLYRFKTVGQLLDENRRLAKRTLYAQYIRYQERLPSKEPIADNGSPLNIDRPQTDNLLLTTKRAHKKGENEEVERTEQEAHKLFTQQDLKPQTLDVQQAEQLRKLNIAEQLQDSLIWKPNEQMALTTTNAKMEHAVPFEEMPGPTSLKWVSNTLKYIPVIGNNILFSRNIKPFNMIFDTYGDIVNLRVPFCGDIVLVQKPEHISEIYRQRNSENISLSSFDSLSEWHKQQAKHRFELGDKFWDTFTYQCSNYTVLKELIDDKYEYLFSKSGVNLAQDIKEILKENYEAKKLFWSNKKYHSTIEKTSDDFIKRLYSIRSIHDEVPTDFHTELYVWSIECMMQTLFGTNVGFYQVSDVQTSEAQRLLQAFIDASDALQQCESGLQLWRVFGTRSWEKLSRSCEVLETILAKHIRMSKLRLDIALKMMIDNNNLQESARIIKSSLVKALILSGCIPPEQILTLCLDMMVVGVNAASISLGFVFYHLAKSPKAQNQLFNEIKRVLPEKNSPLQLEHLTETPFLHGCIMESLRLKHPIPYSTMRLPKNIVLNKYRIPAGTYVLTANEISCMKEENFEDSHRFKPDRWINQANNSLQDAVVPLSEGTRSFLGREWLHQQLAVATAKTVRNFLIGYHYGEIKTTRKILSTPNKPFKFAFTERNA